MTTPRDWLVFTLLTVWQLFATVANADELIALKSARLIDGMALKAIEGQAIIVDGERILDIVAHQDIPPDARVIDLKGATLMPGLIDSHAHPMMSREDYQSIHLHHSSAYKALRSQAALLQLLRAGWTSIRIAGDIDVYYGSMDIKRLIEEGVLEGPRIFGAAHYLSITGGGGDINYFSPEQSPRPDGIIVDGPEEIRKAIRQEAKFGSDWVKVLVTGAFMSVGDNPQSVQFSTEEFQAVIDEANRQGMPVMAHAHATEGIKMAIRLGATSIEHGSYMDDEAIRLMKKHGTYLVPTLYVGDYYNDLREQAVFDDYNANYRKIFLEKVGQAHRSGVKIVVGLDLGSHGFEPSVYVRELAVLMEAGLSAMEAIQAATSVPAEMLGRQEELGAIKPNFIADIIAVGGDPLTDIRLMENVSFVMKNGKIVRNSLSED